MLYRQAFVGRQQDHPVKVPVASDLFQIMPKLQDIDMHDQGLAAAGGDPDGQFIQVVLDKWRDALAFGQFLIENLTKSIKIRTQGRPITEITVKIVLGEQQG